MADAVYSSTTAPNAKASWFIVPSEDLDKVRCLLKVMEVLMSFVAFIMEEVVNSCIKCSALYFFEFVSCTAFLFTLLLLILLSTTLHTRTGITCWRSLDFVYTCGIAVLFFISSVIFASSNGDTMMERSAVAFGFLATAMFIADLVWFMKEHGIPFKTDGKPQSRNGGPASVETPPEAKTLTTATNETE